MNPKSKAHKPDIADRKVRAARARRVTIPPEVAHLGKDPPGKSGGTNMIAELAQMVGMVTSSGEAQEKLLDELIDYEQMK